MAELEPILYLRGERHELAKKVVSGRTRPPWVDIDATGLRASLVQSLDAGFPALRLLPSVAREQVGIPLRIDLRREALAKSNRPSDFLASVGVPPVAAGQPGQLFARVREGELSRLREAVETGTTQKARYGISTIEALTVHDPMTDAFGAASISDVIEVVGRAIDEERLVRLDLFPWLEPATRWTDKRSLAEYLSLIGFPVRAERGSHARASIYVEPQPSADVQSLSGLYGIRSAGIEPRFGSREEFSTQSVRTLHPLPGELLEALEGPRGPGIVGVLDSGISSSIIEPWIQGRETYDVGVDRDPSHGTFVAGLVLAGSECNPGERCFGRDSAVLLDAQVLAASGTDEHLLLERIEEVVRRHPEVRVWNCSFAAMAELSPLRYSVFAAEMDRLSAELDILFVQAVGNYVEAPVRTWPPTQPLPDGISTPSEAVSSLVVGSLSHRGGRSPIGKPASYSRRGPGFGGQLKPDVTYWSGDFGPSGELPHSGIRSICPEDMIVEDVGTSFATPLVSAIAANVWAGLEESAEFDVRPALVKGLLMHSASIGGHGRADAAHRNYYGTGVPQSAALTLLEDAGSFTTIHEVPLVAGIEWWRAPFPVPDCLLVDGRLRAEIFMTVAFAPALDPAFEEEAVRSCVEASFGVIDRSGPRPTISGKVPEDTIRGSHPWEADLLLDGKWSPVRTHYKRYSRGTAGAEWGLKLGLIDRSGQVSPEPETVYVFLTMRGIDEGLPVHADGLRAISRLRLWSAPVTAQTNLVIET